jgi:hypothetical protein
MISVRTNKYEGHRLVRGLDQGHPAPGWVLNTAAPASLRLSRAARADWNDCRFTPVLSANRVMRCCTGWGARTIASQEHTSLMIHGRMGKSFRRLIAIRYA